MWKNILYQWFLWLFRKFLSYIVTGLVSATGYIAELNYENGIRWSDSVLKDQCDFRVMVIESKVDLSENSLDKGCEETLY